jgi:hypothetical protein
MLDAHLHCFEIEKFDNFWLDTTRVMGDYFPIKEKLDLRS